MLHHLLHLISCIFCDEIHIYKISAFECNRNYFILLASKNVGKRLFDRTIGISIYFEKISALDQNDYILKVAGAYRTLVLVFKINEDGSIK